MMYCIAYIAISLWHVMASTYCEDLSNHTVAERYQRFSRATWTQRLVVDGKYGTDTQQQQ